MPIIPALNEAPNMPGVARRMGTDMDEIVFIEGHSVDSDDWPSAQPGNWRSRRTVPVSARWGAALPSPSVTLPLESSRS
ncbi:MAG: hypothetical protein JWP83_1454 [Mycobacterium sp.]|nr:hypothetical protein [Mycobacterium sp.]